MDKPKRPSGGARGVAAKHAAREAARVRESLGVTTPDRSQLGDPPKDARHAADWILRAQLTLAREAMNDAGLPPEQAREQASRILAAATKAIDSAALRAELDSLLALMDRRPDGPQEHSGETCGGSPAPRH